MGKKPFLSMLPPCEVQGMGPQMLAIGWGLEGVCSLLAPQGSAAGTGFGSAFTLQNEH